MRSIALLLPLLLPCDDETTPPRRRHVLDWTAEQRDELAGNLERAHAQLREHAETTLIWPWWCSHSLRCSIAS